MDLTFFDNIKEEEQVLTELEAVKELARKVGLYEYIYNDKAPADGATPGIHIGPVAQELQKVEGLKSCVTPDENGILRVDSDMLALSALAYVAAIARIVMNIEKEQDNDDSTEMGTDSTAGVQLNKTEATGTEGTGAETTGTTPAPATEQPVEPATETDEAGL